MPADEIRELASDFSGAGRKMVAPMRATFDQIGEQTARRWADIARGTAGEHGVHYPDSIDHELVASLGVAVEVGPNSAKKQGSMGRGFEFGSVNQPPHLNGVKAMDQMTPVAEKLVDETISRLLP